MLSASEKGLELKVLDSEDIESGVVLVILRFSRFRDQDLA